MKTKTAVFLGISTCVIFTAFHIYTPKPPVPMPFLPKTFCGMLGDQKIQVSSKYFGTRPDYEGITAWGADRLKVNEDCTSKFNRLEIHANLSNGQPSEPYGQKPFDVVIEYRPSKEVYAITYLAKSAAENADNKLTDKNSDNTVYETEKNEIGHFLKTIVYSHGGQPSHILACVVKKTGKLTHCNLTYNSGKLDVKVSGDYESIIDFAIIETFTSNFISSVRIEGVSNEE